MGVLRSPLVLVSGNVSQLPPGDFISGDTVTAVAGSGLVGGGTDVNEFRFDVGLATPSSGLIYVGTKLALDGVAQRTAEQALISGNLAITSGNAAQFTANQALASGNAALANPGNFTGGTLTSNLTLASGTTSVAPLKFQSGTNLTSAAAGVMEYDGKVIYSTPLSRGVSPSMMFYRLDANLVGANVSTAQAVYGVGVTLQADTSYAFDGVYQLQKNSNTTSHTIGVSYGGTATLNNINVSTIWTRGNVATASASMDAISAFHSFATSAANLVLTSSIATANQTLVARVAGTVSVSSGGTFIPRYTLSATGGPYTTLAGSYFAIWPIGAAGAAVSVGPWA